MTRQTSENQDRSNEHSGTTQDYDADRVGHETAHFDADDVQAIAAQAAEQVDLMEDQGEIEPPLLVRCILMNMFVPAGEKDDFMLSLMAGKPLGWQIMLGRIVGYVLEAKRTENEVVIPGSGEVKMLESIWLRGGFKATCYVPSRQGTKLRSFKSARCILPKGAGELIEEALLQDPVTNPADAPEFDVDIGLEKIKRGAVFYQWIAPSHFATGMDKRLRAIEGRRRAPIEGRIAREANRALPAS